MTLSPTQNLRLLKFKWVLIEVGIKETDEEPFLGKNATDTMIMLL